MAPCSTARALMTVKMVVPVADSRLFWGCIPPLPFSKDQRSRWIIGVGLVPRRFSAAMARFHEFAEHNGRGRHPPQAVGGMAFAACLSRLRPPQARCEQKLVDYGPPAD